MRTTIIALILNMGFPIVSIAGEQKPFRLVSNDDHDRMMKFFPKTDDPSLSRLKERDIVFYDDKVMPPATQDWHGALQGVHSLKYNMSADPSEPAGQPGREFPWQKTAGLESAEGAGTIKFFTLPPGESVRWWRAPKPGDTNPQGTFQWSFPAGTVFGEMLFVNGPDGLSYTFEVRTRTRQKDHWTVNVYRPFPTRNDYESRLKALGVAVAEMRPRGFFRIRNRHPVKIVDRTSWDDELPELPKETVVKLLTETPFRSAMAVPWAEHDGVETHAPTTRASFHVVPKGYTGGYFPVNSKACMDCHRTTGEKAQDIEGLTAGGRVRDWYTTVAGDSAIISWHPFSLDSIAYNGINGPVRLREEFVRAGILKHRND